MTEKGATMIRMAHKDYSGVGLKNSDVRHINAVTVTARQPAVNGETRTETGDLNAADVEKTIHDLRASLNIVIGFTELILDEVMGKINPAQRRSLNDILKNAERLLGLSDDIIKRLENKK
jgi:signal transduction histidine kinase